METNPADKVTELTALVEEITTAGGKTLDEKKLKELKKVCRASDEMVKLAYRLVFHQLSQPHCEIRLLAFLLIKELFQRSHAFRECLVADFQRLLELVLEIEPAKPLPPPLPIAKLLKQESLKTIHAWHSQFGSGYKKLELGYQYLRRCKRVDFEDMEARTRIEREREEEKNRKLELQRVEKLNKLTEEMNSAENDLRDLVMQINNCFELLIPKPEEFLAEEEPESDPSEEIDLRSHGLSNFSQVVEIKLKADPVEVDKDNAVIVQTLREQYSLLKNRFLPMVNRWNVSVAKLSSAETLRNVLDRKNKLEELERKYLELKLPDVPLKEFSDEDSDFEEVEEKEGFEETVKEPDVFALPSANVPSTSKSFSTPTSYPTPGTSRSSVEDTHKRESENEPSHVSEAKRKLLAIAPKLPFHADLITWGQEPQDAPVIARPHGDGHRFWSASANEQEEGVLHPAGRAARLTRVTEFSGQFEPISRSCRTPLPNGKLCPRQDRFKCPFHGKIVPRNEMGEPTDPNQPPENGPSSLQNAVPDWQDPQLLAELQAATGVDLTVGKKTKKGKKVKHPNLTDLKAKQNTVRKRLEKKIFNKATVQRVSSVLDGIDHRKYSDKFGDQFNYSLNR